MNEDRAKQLATILEAIADLEQERTEYIAEYKERMERLRGEAYKLRREILTGQLTLTEQPPEAA